LTTSCHKAADRPVVTYSEDMIRQHALRRLAQVFRISEASLSNEARFGCELKAAPASDFKRNEFDTIHDDIRDVADREILKQIEQGLFVVYSVGDYCDHMVRCSSREPEIVAEILGLPPAATDGVHKIHPAHPRQRLLTVLLLLATALLLIWAITTVWQGSFP